MDVEVKQLLEVIKQNVVDRPPPRRNTWMPLVQTVIAAFIIAIPTVIITSIRTANEIEKQMIKIEARHEREIREVKTDITTFKNSQNFNNGVVESALKSEDHEINLIKIE